MSRKIKSVLYINIEYSVCYGYCITHEVPGMLITCPVSRACYRIPGTSIIYNIMYQYHIPGIAYQVPGSSSLTPSRLTGAIYLSYHSHRYRQVSPTRFRLPGITHQVPGINYRITLPGACYHSSYHLAGTRYHLSYLYYLTGITYRGIIYHITH